MRVVISGIGSYIPENSVTTEELVDVFNKNLDSEKIHGNQELKNADLKSIQHITGIKNRYFTDSSGILNTDVMHPIIKKRDNNELSLQCDMGIKAAKKALLDANTSANKIDAVIVACTQTERPYPSIAIEIQNALNIEGFAFDMSAACSSAILGIQSAYNIIANHQAKSVLVISPEIVSATANFKNRDSFFLFGDASTAILIENLDYCKGKELYEIVSSKLYTSFSNNIRCNFGFLNRYDPKYNSTKHELFVQDGLQVFYDIIDLVPEHISNHLQHKKLSPQDMELFWLHQANAKMNKVIAKKLFADDTNEFIDSRFPNVIDHYGNTASTGCVLSMHANRLKNKDDKGMLCAFGAGYSIGSIIIQKI